MYAVKELVTVPFGHFLCIVTCVEMYRIKSEEAHALAGLSFFVLFASRAGLLLLAEWKEQCGLEVVKSQGEWRKWIQGSKFCICVCMIV